MCNKVLLCFDLNLTGHFHYMVAQFSNIWGGMVPTVTKLAQNVSKRPILKFL